MQQKFAKVTCFVTNFSPLGAKDADTFICQLARNSQVPSLPTSTVCQGAITALEAMRKYTGHSV